MIGAERSCREGRSRLFSFLELVADNRKWHRNCTGHHVPVRGRFRLRREGSSGQVPELMMAWRWLAFYWALRSLLFCGGSEDHASRHLTADAHRHAAPDGAPHDPVHGDFATPADGVAGTDRPGAEREPGPGGSQGISP